MDKSYIKKEKVAVVIVTFNRKNLLKECLEGVLSQTRKVDKIFIIDNASTDGTSDFLKQEGFLHNELISYERIEKNTGSAGGFHEGIKKAYRDNYDWFWLMDDDVKMKDDGLGKLLKFQEVSLCIHGRKTYLDGQFLDWEDYIDVPTGKTFGSHDAYFYKYDKRFVTINFGCFEGMLIHRDIVGKIGLPDKRFFIKGDDTIYGFLASLHTNVLYVNEMIFYKLIRPQNSKTFLGRGSGRSSDLILYHAIRNNFLIEKYFKLIYAEEKINRKINHKPMIIGMALRMMVGVVVYDDKKIKRLGIILKALFDGYRMAKNFSLPKIEL